MTSDVLTSIHGNKAGINRYGQLVMQHPDTGLQYAVTAIPDAGNEVASTTTAASVGAAAGSGVAVVIEKKGHIATLDFTLTNVAITWTDAAGSGSFGSIKIFDFAEGAWQVIGSRTNLSWLGDALIDTNAGDMAFVFGLGSVAANAGDAALTGTEVDYVAVSSTITLAAKVAAASTILKGAGAAPVDGTGTASDIYLNASGSAATSDANGVLTVSGTITLVLAYLGDD